MATNTLTDQNISDTYAGVLHAQGVTFGAGQVLIYDGVGVASSLKLGLWGQGATIGGSLSCGSLIVNGMTYPVADGTAAQLMKTDGAGTLSFDSLATSDFPVLVPSPAATYVGLSSITVDATGRVTQVKESLGGSSSTSQSHYVTPIVLLETTNDYSDVIDTTQVGMPSDATYAILRIEGELEYDLTPVGYVPNELYATIDVNSVEAQYYGVRQWTGSHTDTYSGVTTWYAKIDGSNEFQLDISKSTTGTLGATNMYTKISLLGFANFQQLTNP